METSPSIGNISAALAKAQGEFPEIKRESVNPFFGKKYADLSAILKAVRAPLAKNELAVVQGESVGDNVIKVITMLCHSSGEWFRNVVELAPKDNTPQVIGSALTYGRRYGLSALLSVASEDDDDGNESTDNGKKPAPKKEATPSKAPEQIDRKAQLIGLIKLARPQLGERYNTIMAQCEKDIGTERTKWSVSDLETAYGIIESELKGAD